MVREVNVGPAQAGVAKECRAYSWHSWVSWLTKRLKVTALKRQTRSRKIRTLRHAGGCEEGRLEEAVIVPRPR